MHILRRLLVPIVGTAVLFSLGIMGCSDSSITTPTTTINQNEDPALLGGLFGDRSNDEIEWYFVAEKRVRANRTTVVEGSNYKLTFPSGALSQSTNITIQEHNSKVIDVQFGPHGTQFGVPVTLEIDYKGTTADPLSRHFDGTLPLLFYWNEGAGLWEALTGINNVLTRTYTVELEHFSRYSFRRTESTAGW